MSSIGEQLQNRVRVSDKVVASARTHGAKMASILAKQVMEVEGPATPATEIAFKGVIFGLANTLEYCTNALRHAEQMLAGEKADDAPIRQKRNDTASDVANNLILLRSTVDDHLGPVGVNTYGLAGETSRVPRKILQQAENVVQLLEKTPVQLTSSFGTSFDSAAAAASLKAKAAELRSVLADDDREARELEDAFAMRDRAAAAWSDAYQGTATMLEGMYRRAGFKDLAEKVRPTVRRLRGEDPGPDEEGETPTPENG